MIIATVASVVALARYLDGLIVRHKAGDLSDEDLQKAWDNLQVRRDDTKDLWADAKRVGGYK